MTIDVFAQHLARHAQERRPSPLALAWWVVTGRRWGDA